MQKEKTGSKIKPSTSNIVFNILAYSLVAIVSIVCVLPFLLVVSGSFTDNGVIMREGYSLWPKVFSLEAYKVIFKNPASILQAYKMTIYYTVVGTAVGLFMTTMTAYVVSRKEFKYRNIVTFMMYFTTIFGGGMIPTFLLINKLGLYDNPLSQILPVCFSIWNIILVKAFFSSIPESLREAAKIDCANVYQILLKVYLPLSKPILAVIAVYTIVGVWNSWFNAMVYLPHTKWQPLQLYLRRVLIENTKQITEVLSPSAAQELARKQMSNAQLKYAMIIFTTLPVLFTYPFFQKYFVKGVMLGSLKE